MKTQLTKIEADTINGVCVVENFTNEENCILYTDATDFLTDLAKCKDGEIMQIEVMADEYEMIDNVYGIKK